MPESALSGTQKATQSPTTLPARIGGEGMGGEGGGGAGGRRGGVGVDLEIDGELFVKLIEGGF